MAQGLRGAGAAAYHPNRSGYGHAGSGARPVAPLWKFRPRGAPPACRDTADLRGPMADILRKKRIGMAGRLCFVGTEGALKIGKERPATQGARVRNSAANPSPRPMAGVARQRGRWGFVPQALTGPGAPVFFRVVVEAACILRLHLLRILLKSLSQIRPRHKPSQSLSGARRQSAPCF
ncbi:unnamed protein product, partial [Amoebophrya sp. A120]|eukprot:GSA120T00002915001.1